MFALTSRKLWTITPSYARSSYLSFFRDPLYNGSRVKGLYRKLPRIFSPVRHYTDPQSNKETSPSKDTSQENSQQKSESASGSKKSSRPKKVLKAAKLKKKTDNDSKGEEPPKEDIAKVPDGKDVLKKREKAKKKKKKAASTAVTRRKSVPPSGRQTLLSILGDVEMSEASKEAIMKAFKLASMPAKSTRKASSKSSNNNTSLTPMDKFETMDSQELPLTPVDKEEIHVPTLSYGLDRVLFNHGVYQLQDPRTRVFNFDPYLQEIMPVSQFDYGALGQYITSSRDAVLLAKATEEKKKYSGSTSSMSSALSHFHFLLSNWRPIEYGNLSCALPEKLKSSNFSAFTRAPSAIFLRYRGGSYAIDADKEFDGSNILAMLGKSMEKLLTLPTEHYEKYRRVNSDQLTKEQRNERESYHYTTFGDFLLRSQLDAYDPRLPGTGKFDLKTRCVVSVRMDVSEYENSKAYEIRKAKGEWESYEREYYDMIRAAFLKYSMQVRMGRMDGIFVAFHNTARIFGFQYISLEEMDYSIHGTYDLTLGDSEFKLSLHLLNKILDRATAKFPEKTLRLYFETPSKAVGESTYMNVIAQPLEDEEVDLIQAGAKERIEKFEREVLGIKNDFDNEEVVNADVDNKPEFTDADVDVDNKSEVIDPDVDNEQVVTDVGVENAEEDNDAKKEKEFIDVENEEVIDEDVASDQAESSSTVTSVDQANTQLETELHDNNHEKQTSNRSSLDEALGASLDQTLRQLSTTSENILENATCGSDLESKTYRRTGFPNDTIGSKIENSTNNQEPIGKAKDDINDTDWTTRPFLAMRLTIRNKVNGEFVIRPVNLTKDDKWSIDYNLTDIPTGQKSKDLYHNLRQHLKKINSGGLSMSPDKPPNGALEKNLRKYIEKGRIFRQLEDDIQSKLPKKVLDVAVWGKQSSENLRKEALAAQKKLSQTTQCKTSEIEMIDSSSSMPYNN